MPAHYAARVSRRRVLLSGAVVAAAAAGVAARLRLSRNENRLDVPVVTPSTARGTVEAALGSRGERRNLALDFEPAAATTWELLIDGGTFFPRLLEDIAAATSDVHILIFGFKSGLIGDDFRDQLTTKAAAGVGVRIITEAAFSQPGLGSKAFYRSLVDGGVQVVANQGGFVDLDGLLGARRIDWRFDDFGHFDHRKVVVIDGRVGYVGGPGIEDHYATGTHDVMLRLEGPIVAQLQAVFLLSWQLQGGPLPQTAAELDRFFPPLPEGEGLPMELLLNNPGGGHRPIKPAFLDAIANAQRRLYVISPYLADHDVLRGILAAARRGVETRVIVPEDPHSLAAKAGVRHWFKALRAAGVDLREHPELAHAKVVLSDDLVLVGTSNLDALSLRQNWEMQVRIRDAVVADHFARELFDRDIELTHEARMPEGQKEKAINAFFSAISPLL
jgi:cardiolipin synthase A/B